MFPFWMRIFAPASAASGRGRGGLGVKLQLAFASIALLTVVAAAGALFLFARIEDRVGDMVERRAPEAMAMLKLETLVEELTALAPAIASARNAEELNTHLEVLIGLGDTLRASLEAADPDVRARLGELAEELDAALVELAAQRERLNGQRGALLETAERLKAVHEEAIKAVSAPIDDLAFELVLGLEDLTAVQDHEDLQAAVGGIIDGSWEPIQALFLLRAEVNRIQGLLAQAAMAADASLLQPLAERFTAASEAAAAALAEVPEAYRDDIAPLLESLIAYGQGADSVFERRRQLLRSEAELRAQAGRAREIAERFDSLVTAKVEDTEAALSEGVGAVQGMLNRARWLLLAAVLVVLLVSGVIGWRYIQGQVVRRLRALHDATLAVAEGRRDVDIPTEGSDELAAMGRALAVFRDKSAEVERLEAERRALEAKAEEEKRAAQRALADRLEKEIGAIADHFAGAAAALRAAAEDLASGEGREASGKIDLVARTCRELEQAAREIARQMERARAIGETANDNSKRSTRAVEELDAAIGEIEEVVTLISDIAEQTNLLALNATIEAARAGESGRGFAVVASEVKALANQTAEATGRIAQRIAAIRETSRSTVESITHTASSVQELADVAGAVAAALEQQSAAIDTIQDHVQVAIGSAGEMREAAGGVAREAERLRTQMRGFVEQIRAS